MPSILSEYVEQMIIEEWPKYKRYPCVMPSWDNSARRTSNAVIFRDSDPIIFKKWLQHVKVRFQSFSEEENLIFINSWNEWAEGNHLEPCQKWGTAYLKVVREVFV